MGLKSTVGIIFGLFYCGYMVAQPPKITEQTVQLERFGFKAGPCESWQSAQFIDDHRLVLSAPLAGACDKSNWSNPLQTQLTVIDLHGAVLATKTRPDIDAVHAGPIGYAAVCTKNSLELVSGDLNTAKVISIRPSKFSLCSNIDGLSPSRRAISIRDFGESPKSFARHRLIDAKSEQPIAEQQFGKGDSLAGITDSGYAVCTSVEHHDCEQLTVDGSAWVVGFHGVVYPQGLFLTPNQLLLPQWQTTEKALISIFPDGKREQVVNLRGLQPLNVDNPSLEISATNPRRILYSATGCYLGDFDDCYAFVFERVVVFDPQTHQVLFKKNEGQDATSILSPNGHTVVVLDKTKLHIYMIP